MLGSSTREITVSGTVTSTGKGNGLSTVDFIRCICLKDCVGIIIVINILVKSDSDATKSVNDGFERTPVDMSIILEIDAKYITDFIHESGSASVFVVTFHIITPIDFVDLRGGSTIRGNFEIAR